MITKVWAKMDLPSCLGRISSNFGTGIKRYEPPPRQSAQTTSRYYFLKLPVVVTLPKSHFKSNPIVTLAHCMHVLSGNAG